jgi:signal transduction histidine kinase
MAEEKSLPLYGQQEIMVAGSPRWTGQVHLHGDTEATPMLVLEHGTGLVAIPRRCPHQGYDLTDAPVSENGMIVCPHHGRCYPLDCSKHFSLAAERRDGEFFVLLPDEESVRSLDRDAHPEHLEQENARLMQELESLRAANRALEARIGTSMQSMDSVLRDVEARKNDLECTSREFESMAELVTRITDNIHDIMLVTGTDGRVQRASRSALTFFGVPLQQLVGLDIDTLLNPADLERLKPRLQGMTWATRPLIYELIYADDAFEEEVELRPLVAAGNAAVDGPSLCHLLHGTVLYDSHGKEEGLILLANDISSVKQREQRAHEQELEKSLAVLRNAVGNISQGISMIGADLRLVVCNSRFLELLELPDSLGIPGTRFEAFMRFNAERGEYGPGDADQQVRARVAQAQRFEAHAYERERPDGTIIEVVGKPLPDGGFVTTYTDITERKRNEMALREFNATLEQRIDERTVALQHALADLGKVIENLEQAQDELIRSEKLASLGAMVAGVAHELNTPIGNGLMVASHLVECNKNLSEAMKSGLKRSALDEFLAGSQSAGDLLVRNLTKAAELVASFKQVAVDQTSSQRRHFDLAEMVEEVVTTLGPTIRKTPYAVNTRIAKGIVLDSYPGPLGQVLTNLINNAILHGFDGCASGQISIEADAPGDAERVVLKITDNGRGIAPDVLPRIFDPFFTTKLGQGGSGLGLNIAHNMVSGILDGRISADSVQGKGTCFTLALALTAPDRRSKPSADAAPGVAR